MGQLILEFPLDWDLITLDPDGKLRVGLGNGVILKASAPDWVERIKRAKLALIMEVEGSPPSADPGKTPVQ